jgi:hypothetical protein
MRHPIPRAEHVIDKTIAGLRTVSFQQDPLMDINESFMVSIWSSAVKRDGAVIEAAIMDAVEQTKGLQLLPVAATKNRRVDVLFEMLSRHSIVGLEIKRGVLHDSTKLRQFRLDLIEMPKILQAGAPAYPIDRVYFHLVFVSGVPPLREGLRLSDLKKLYGLDVTQHVDAARRHFSRQVRTVIEERTTR